MNELKTKQIWSFVNEENDNNVFEEALEKTLKTKILSQTETPNIFIFHSKFIGDHKFEIVKEKILLNEKLVNNLTNLILKNLELSKKIPTMNGLEKGDYKEREKGNVKSIISSLVFYKWYNNFNNLSVLDMAADIMYKIACSNHPFTNGNKRTALLSCGAFFI